MFRVGDIVECIEDEDHFVLVGAIGKVTRIGRRVSCLWTTGPYHDANMGAECWSIEPARIKLAKPKLETLIKRIQLGRKATIDLIEHYDSEVAILDDGVKIWPSVFFSEYPDEIEFITDGD